MGLIDFLLFGAFMNSLRNRQDNNPRPNYSGDNYDQGYEDGYTDGYLDHDDYQDHDSCIVVTVVSAMISLMFNSKTIPL